MEQENGPRSIAGLKTPFTGHESACRPFASTIIFNVAKWQRSFHARVVEWQTRQAWDLVPKAVAIHVLLCTQS